MEAATRRYPDDPEAWYLLGETADHFGPFAGRSMGEVLRAFDRSLALDSAFAPAYIHPIEVSAKDGPAAIQRYLRPYLAMAPKEEEAEGGRLMAALLAPGVTAADVPRITERASMAGLFSAQSILGSLPDREELGVALMRRGHRGGPTH